MDLGSRVKLTTNPTVLLKIMYLKTKTVSVHHYHRIDEDRVGRIVAQRVGEAQHSLMTKYHKNGVFHWEGYASAKSSLTFDWEVQYSQVTDEKKAMVDFLFNRDTIGGKRD